MIPTLFIAWEWNTVWEVFFWVPHSSRSRLLKHRWVPK